MLIGGIQAPLPFATGESLWLIAGDLGLSRFEDKLSDSWSRGFGKDPAALRATSAFYRIMQAAGEKVGAVVALIDVGPNLGAINRAALLAADYLVIPLAADLFSLQGLKNLGPTVRLAGTLETGSEFGFSELRPARRKHGSSRLRRTTARGSPRQARSGLARWLDRIPGVYREGGPR